MLLLGDRRGGRWDISAGERAFADLLNSSLAGTGETILRRDTFNSMCRVEILHDSDLPASSATLTRCDSGVGEEVFPDL